MHEFRLSIKKLRSFYKLTEQIILNDTKDHTAFRRRVRQLYKVAGQLRDTQVQIQLLAWFQEKTGIDFPEFGKWLTKREKKKIMQFFKKPHQLAPFAAAMNNYHEIGNLLALAGDETILNGARKVLSQLFGEAQDLSLGNMNERNLHRIRTIIKQMRYIQSIMHHSYPDFLFTKLPVETLREIEVAAGQWHDYLVRVEMLKSFVEKIDPLDSVNKFKYQKLLNACQAELEISFIETSQLVRRSLLGDNSKEKSGVL